MKETRFTTTENEETYEGDKAHHNYGRTTEHQEIYEKGKRFATNADEPPRMKKFIISMDP